MHNSDHFDFGRRLGRAQPPTEKWKKPKKPKKEKKGKSWLARLVSRLSAAILRYPNDTTEP